MRRGVGGVRAGADGAPLCFFSCWQAALTAAARAALRVPARLLLRLGDALAGAARDGVPSDGGAASCGARRAVAMAVVVRRGGHQCAPAAAAFCRRHGAPFERGAQARLLWAAQALYEAAPGATAHWEWGALHDALAAPDAQARYGAACLLARVRGLSGGAAEALRAAACGAASGGAWGNVLAAEARTAGAAVWAGWEAEVAMAAAAPYLAEGGERAPGPVPMDDDAAAAGAGAGAGAGDIVAAADFDAMEVEADVDTPAVAPATPPAEAEGFAARFVDVCGVQLPRRPGTAPEPADDTALVPTEGAQSALLACALALAQRRPVLLEGAPGSGKSALIRELARRTGHAARMAVVHLDDQMDAKALLGTYACTKVPGEFVWAPGVLTQAATEGFWVVFEDIDLAPPEVVTALLPLLESRTLHLPGRAGALAAHPHFQLFGTVSQGGSGAVAGGGAAHERARALWAAVQVDAPSDDDVGRILSALHPELERIAPAVMGTLEAVRAVAHPSHPQQQAAGADGGADGGEHALAQQPAAQPAKIRYARPITVREALALARRLGGVAVRARPAGAGGAAALSTDGREEAMRESMDVFAAHAAEPRERSVLLSALATAWGLPAERADFFDTLHAPTMTTSKGQVCVGRAAVARIRQNDAGSRESQRRLYVRTGSAMRALERVARAAQLGEPCLLVGETGVGKTASLQYLADEAGAKLTVVNMSQQSDATDLLGGHKPVEAALVAGPLLSHFELLFERTFPSGANAEFLTRSRSAAHKRKWKQLFKAFRLAAAHVAKLARGASPPEDTEQRQEEHSQKRQKRVASDLLREWEAFAAEADDAERQLEASKGGFAFDFVEGVLVRALREGHWVLLDEINLAPAEALERLAGLLESPTASLALTERGDAAQIPRHANFRLFAAMNPATDVGKRELAPALRARFVELWCPEASSKEDLGAIVAQYLSAVPRSVAPVDAVVDFYSRARAQAAAGALVDGGGAALRFSLRTLTRALEYAAAALPAYGLHRALKDGFEMAFLTALAGESRAAMERLLRTVLLRGVEARVSANAGGNPASPSDGQRHVLVEGFWARAGGGDVPEAPDEGDTDPAAAVGKYVITASVKSRLRDLARAVLLRRYPVLLQGPTSAGKTSLVVYLAERTGHEVVRINNHEHTDLAEYLGTYVTDAKTGKLKFVEGALVRAMRRGAWIILDELNLAPSDVLEALNRLLDDNRELFVPELQEVVRPHPSFMLFATQNPPGAYGGRKVLSKAFRNRFMELHVDDIPEAELITIVQRRCGVAPSYCKAMVAAMKELQLQRVSGAALLGRHGAMTSRDLLRWARRDAQGYANLAAEGFMLLAERLRSDGERDAVRAVLEKELRAKVDAPALYSPEESEPFKELAALLAAARARGEAAAQGVPSVVWTAGMRRMFVLLERCMRHSEPALIVGETGCGKTTICQLLALLYGRPLYIINCHQHTESSDFLGGFRPVRDREAAIARYAALASQLEALATKGMCEKAGVSEAAQLAQPPPAVVRDIKAANAAASAKATVEAMQLAEVAEGSIKQATALIEEMMALSARAQSLFEWVDGPLVEAMRVGGILLVDEISIAEDSVLERLNSVLEPERTLMLAEKGGAPGEQASGTGGETIIAHPDFRLVATMNPGGDFGKKELSPALRNRFTEVWAASISDVGDLELILRDRLHTSDTGGDEALAELAGPLLAFWSWFESFEGRPSGTVLSVRDLLAWAGYIGHAAQALGPHAALVHGAYLVLLDGVGLGSGAGAAAVTRLRKEARRKLFSLLPEGIAAELAHDPALMEAGEHSRFESGKGTTDAMATDETGGNGAAITPEGMFGSAPFFIPMGPLAAQASPSAAFDMGAPTAARCVRRLLRALQLPRAVLLEGSPGVGKSSLVAAVARASGRRLVRINLSEQSDIMDLLGTDLPVEGGAPGDFRWCDGVLLRAVKAGDWVLLDELNLAPQAVLEGLNALLDHRAEVFIPELGKAFPCAPGFRILAAQNPLQEGGGRRGLPKSFLNRFSKVAVEAYSAADFRFITGALFPQLTQTLVRRMIAFTTDLLRATMEERRFGLEGAPWEFNLRDVLRWGELATGCRAGEGGAGDGDAGVVSGRMEAALQASLLHSAQLIFIQRFRSVSDRAEATALLREAFDAGPVGSVLCLEATPELLVGPRAVSIGAVSLPRRAAAERLSPATVSATAEAAGILPLTTQATSLAATLCGLARGWMVLLVGGPAVGKTTLARAAATLVGRRLHELSLTASTDTTELLGCFEQADTAVSLARLEVRVRRIAQGLADVAAEGLAGDQADAQGVSVGECLAALREADMAQHAIDRAKASEWGAAGRSSGEGASAAAQAAQHVAALDCYLSVLRSLRVACPMQLWSDAAVAESEAIAADAAKLRAVVTAAAGATGGRFEWVDGVVVRAAMCGDWLLLDNANVCNAAVLDRLNPLFEPDGELLLPERGLVGGGVVSVKPHPAFRVILTADPHVGEPSRAMRNRGLEICVLPVDAVAGKELPALAEATSSASLVKAAGDARLDAVTLVMASGVPSRALAEAMVDAHAAARAESLRLAGASRAPGRRSLLAWACLHCELVARGAAPQEAAAAGWDQVYVRPAVAYCRDAVVAAFKASQLSQVAGAAQSRGLLASLSAPTSGDSRIVSRLSGRSAALSLLDPGRWPATWSIGVAADDARLACILRDAGPLLRLAACMHTPENCAEVEGGDESALRQLAALPGAHCVDEATAGTSSAAAAAMWVAARHFMERAAPGDAHLRAAWLRSLAAQFGAQQDDTQDAGPFPPLASVGSALADCAGAMGSLVGAGADGVVQAAATNASMSMRRSGHWVPTDEWRYEVPTAGVALACPVLARSEVFDPICDSWSAAECAAAALRAVRAGLEVAAAEERALRLVCDASGGAAAACALGRSARSVGLATRGPKRGLPKASPVERPLVALVQAVSEAAPLAGQVLAKAAGSAIGRGAVHGGLESLVALHEWRALLLACVVAGPLDAESFAPIWAQYASALSVVLDAAGTDGPAAAARAAAAEVSAQLAKLAPPWDPLLLLHGGRPLPPRTLALGDCLLDAVAECSKLALTVADAGYEGMADADTDGNMDIDDLAAKAAARQPPPAACFAADATLRVALARGLCLVRQTATARSLDRPDGSQGNEEVIEARACEMVRLIASQVASAAKAIADKPDISALPLQEAGWLSCVSGDGNGIGLPATARAFPPALCRWGVVRDLQRDLQPLVDGFILTELLRMLAVATAWLATGADTSSPSGREAARRLGAMAERVIALGAESATLPPAALAPVQQLVWLCAIVDEEPAAADNEAACERSAHAAEVVHELWVQLHRAGWASALALLPSAVDSRSTGAEWSTEADWSARHCAGSPRLFTSWATLCLRRIVSGAADPTAVSSARAKAMQLRLAARCLCDILGSRAAERLDGGAERNADLAALCAQLAAVCRAHTDAVAPEHRETFLERVDALASGVGAEATGPVLSALRACLHPGIAAAAAPAPGGCLSLAFDCWRTARVSTAAGDDLGAMAAAGRAWALLGALRLSLVVPPTPIDPAAVHGHDRRAFGALAARAGDELAMREAIAAEGCGTPDDAVVSDLTARHATAEARALSAARREAPRPATSKYASLHADLRRFSANVASPAAVAAVVGASVDAEDSSASARAQVLVSSATQLAERTERSYAHYADVARPAVQAALELRYGVAMWAAATSAASQAQADSRLTLQCALASLMRYPAVDGAIGASATNAQEQDGSPALHPLIAPLVTGRLHEAIAQLHAAKARAAADADEMDARGSRAIEKERLDGEARTVRDSLATRARLLHVALERCSQALLARGPVASLVHAHVATSRQLVALWEEAKDAEARLDAEREALFKTKPAHNAAPDDDAMAQARFERMFPDHTKDFEDLLDAPDALEASDKPQLSGKAAAEAAARRQAVEVAAAEIDSRAGRLRASIEDGEALRAVVCMHSAVFERLDSDGASGAGDAATGVRPEEESFVAAYDAAARLLPLLDGFAPPALDAKVADGHIVRACLEHRRVLKGYYADADSGSSQPSKAGKAGKKAPPLPSMDINTDSNPSEAALLGPLVVAVQERAAELLEEFEEHAVLKQLCAICVRVADLPLSAPLAKLLTGAELLLSRAQMWEELAARHVSIYDRLKPIELLIKRWRTIELKSWPSLLDTREAAAARRAAKWWLHTWSLLHSFVAGDEDGGESDDKDSVSLAAVGQVIEEFVQKATLGDFDARLRILRAFEREMRVLSRAPTSSCNGSADGTRERAAALATILSNAAGYYSRLREGVVAAVAAARKPIEEELQGFCKLARWEDRNFYALKASADRAHYTLHKFSRKYDEALMEPAATTLTGALERVGASDLAAAPGEMRSAEGGAARRARLATAECWRAFTAANAAAVDAAPSSGVEDAGDQSLYQNRLPHVVKTAQRLLLGSSDAVAANAKSRSCTPSAAGAAFTEELAVAVIERAAALRAMGEDEAKQRVAKAAKRKALADLLRKLSEVGLGRRKGGAREPLDGWMERATPESAFASLADLGGRLAASGGVSSIEAERGMALAQRSVRYYSAAVANTQALRAAYEGGHHPELSGREAQAGVAAADGLLVRMQDQRQRLGEDMRVLARLDDAVVAAERIGVHGASRDANRACELAARALGALSSVRGLAEGVVLATDALVATDGPAAAAGSAVAAKALASEAAARLGAAESSLRETLMAERVRWVDGTGGRDAPAVVSLELERVTAIAEAVVQGTRDEAHDASDALSSVPCWSAFTRAADEAAETLAASTAQQAASAGCSEIDASRAVEDCVTQLMLAAQGAAGHRQREAARGASKAAGVGVETDEEEEAVGNVREWDADAEGLWAALRPARVAAAAEAAMSALAAAEVSPARTASLARLLAPLRCAAFAALGDSLELHKAAGKLSYVLCNLFVSLCKEGFCTPQEQAEDGDGKGEFKESDGTGMGEGQGTKDVGDEIENEDQLIGTRDQEQQEQQEKQDRDKDEEDKGVEMQQDFEGAMEDLSEDDQEQQDEDDGDDEDRLDDVVGEAGEDAEVVDEKLWDPNEDERTRAEEEKYEEGRTAQADEQELEYRGKDDPDAEEDDGDEGGAGKDKDTQQRDEDDADMEEEEQADEGADEAGADDQGAGVEQSHGMELKDEEEMELPENMQLDGDDEGEAAEEEGGDAEEDGGDAEDAAGDANGGEDGDVPEDGDAAEGEEEADGADDDANEDGPSPMAADGADDEQDDGGDDVAGHDAREADGEEGEHAEPEPEPEDDQGITAAGAEQGKDGAEEEAAAIGEVDELPDGVDLPSAQPRSDEASAAVAARSGAQAGQGQRADGDQQREAAGASADMPEGDADGEAAAGADAGDAGQLARLKESDTGGGDEERKRRDNTAASEANPYRSLGDATRQWRDALPVIADAVEDADEDAGGEEQDEGAAEGDEYEFAGADETGGQQVMAAATEEQAALQRQRAGERDEARVTEGTEEEEEEETDPNAVDADGDAAMAEAEDDKGGADEERGEAVARRAQPNAADAGRDAPTAAAHADLGAGVFEVPETEKTLTELLEEDQADGAAGDLALAKAVVERLAVEDIREASAQQPVEYRRSQAEGALQRAQEAGDAADMEQWRSAWRRYEALTSGAAQELAEQLRLILEPTLAARLQGDYRTGKRIAMKKVIPYIASQFRRDKIWLRRTRPSRRTYQIVLAVDDSRSMRENACAPRAVEALVTLSKAMASLEVGEVGLLAFGGSDSVRELHALGQPWSDEAGAAALSQLTFSQDNTIQDEPQVALLRKIGQTFEAAAARAPRSSAHSSLHQVALIVADGQVHERGALAALVRGAQAKGQLIVLIILDTNEEQSLLDQRSVSFENGAPVFKPYLQSFPYDRYCVVRDVRALPAVLSSIMRQCIEMSAN